MSESLILSIASHVIQVTIVASFALLLVRFVFCRVPKFVYWLSMVVLLSCLIPPVVICPLPSIGSLIESQMASIRPYGPSFSADGRYQIVNSGSPLVSEIAWLDGNDGKQPETESNIAGADGGTLTFAALQQGPPEWPPFYKSIAYGVFAFYLAGFLFVAMRDLRAVIRLRCNLFLNSTAFSSHKSSSFNHLSQEILPQRHVRLMVTNNGFGPASFGLLRPTVVIPEELLNHKDLELMFTHELVHLRRYDYLVSGLQLVCKWVWWFHPAIHLLSNQANMAREKIVDSDVVARTGVGAVQYGRCLLDIASNKNQLAFNQMGATSKRQLEDRLQQLKNEKSSWRMRGIFGFVFALFILIAIPDRSRSDYKQHVEGYVIAPIWVSDSESASPTFHLIGIENE